MYQNNTEADQNSIDSSLMNYALNLSKKNIGLTGKNPSIAALITKNGEILASGITRAGGSPHAEIDAINKINNKEILKECELYVTLEPCSHYGQNPPCVEEIIKYQFKRVIIANIDPNPLVNKQGIAKLEDAGIKVTTKILEDKAQEINKFFFKAITTKLPFITLKLATSLDGKIACANGDSKWITNELSRKYGHLLRAKHDGILIGKSTLLNDQPKLNCRISGLEEYCPQPIIFTSSNLSDINTNSLTKKPLILTPDKDLKQSLQELTKLGINSILIEGGAKTASHFLKANLIDEIIIFRSNKILGQESSSMFGKLEISNVKEAIKNFKRYKTQTFDNDIVELLKT